MSIVDVLVPMIVLGPHTSSSSRIMICLILRLSTAASITMSTWSKPSYVVWGLRRDRTSLAASADMRRFLNVRASVFSTRATPASSALSLISFRMTE